MILLSRVLLLAVTIAYASPANARSTSSADTAAEKIKFGLQLKFPCLPKFGVFGEYKLSEMLGIQTALLYFSDFYLMQDLQGKESHQNHALVLAQYISMPVILRFYPGVTRQLCIFGGLQINYLLGGNILYMSASANQMAQFKKLFSKENILKLKDEKESGNLSLHLVMGFDYEAKGGFISGLEIGKGLSTFIKCDDSKLNWTFKPVLGYNFGKLL